MTEIRKRTSWRIKLADTLAAYVIAFGALATIAAILLVVFVLFWTTLPLIRVGELQEWQVVDLPEEFEQLAIDETGSVMWGLTDQSIQVVSLSDGSVLKQYLLEDLDMPHTCSGLSSDGKQLALGYSNGTFRTVSLEFETRLIPNYEVPAPVSDSFSDSIDGSLYQPFDDNSWRKISLAVPTWSMPRKISDAAIDCLDFTLADATNRLSTVSNEYALAVSGGNLLLAKIEQQENLLSGEVSEQIKTSACKIQSRDALNVPLRVMLLNGAQHALVVWRTGTIDRFEASGEELLFRESTSTSTGGVSTSCAIPMSGRQMAILGTQEGLLQAWMVSSQESGDPASQDDVYSDSGGLLLAHEIQAFPESVQAIASSERQHLIVACAEGSKTAKVFQLTTDNLVVSKELSHSPVKACFSTDGRKLVCVGNNRISSSNSQFMHPQASWRGFFGSIWYQGYDAPEYIWQPDSGGSNTESKLSLVPLLFGTLKATFFAMLVGVPLAIGSAIYSNSFLSEKTRASIKPFMELMANFPGVIIGYIVASVLAPVLRNHLTEVLLLLFVLPITFYYMGLLWNFLPQRVISRFGNYQLLYLAFAFLPAFLLTLTLAPPTDKFLFDGDLSTWLGNRQGSTFGGWFSILLPLFLVIAGYASLRFGTSGGGKSRSDSSKLAKWSILRTTFMFALLTGIAIGCASLLSAQGLDLRRQLTVGYQDGNAMLLGLALGFFVIPIIYTIADDAIQSVPQHLREASAACGATQWQTTTRIVLPTATSGLISAVMLGIGRAAGETMIVLMVAGNTPILDWSPFSGLRALTSTLAIELPKTTKGSTHFHTLFLAAFLLFVITLAANWVAEMIRSKFRKSVQGL